MKSIKTLLLLGAAALTVPAFASDSPLPVKRLREIAAQVRPERLQATIAALVGFGTRHTLSSTTDEKRGIGAAQRWVAAQFDRVGKSCDGCLTLMTPSDSVTGTRLPQPVEIVDVLAVQKGTDDPDRVVIIAGHLDSRVTDVMDSTHDAPGANDDGSGVAAVIEAARVLSHYKFPATIVYAVLTGEEQGLYGGKLLAKTAKEQGWQVEAMLNNDIIGNVEGQNGKIDKDHFRLFSEGVRVGESDKDTAKRRLFGGEVDSASRNLARLVAELTDATLPGFHGKLIYRADRFGRGGDHLPMQEAGYTAIRLTESAENYTRQHQDLRIENGLSYGDVAAGVNFPYLTHMTAVNVVTLADLAWAPAPPLDVKIQGAVSTDTGLNWASSPGAAGYWARWRASDASVWQQQRYVAGATETALKDVIVDDWIFGVSAVSPQGFISPSSFAGSR